jgi:hypothetical protein
MVGQWQNNWPLKVEGEGFKSSSYILPRFLGMYKWVAFIGCYVANIAYKSFSLRCIT